MKTFEITSEQFYSEDGQKLRQLEYEKEGLLNRQGYYSKGVAKLAHRIAKLEEKIKAKDFKTF